MEELKARFGPKHTYFSCLLFCVILLFCSVCFADGTYQVTNENGVNYLETSNEGSWCITKSDLKFTGQSGNYSIWKDQQGTFLLINKQRIYIDERYIPYRIFKDAYGNILPTRLVYDDAGNLLTRLDLEQMEDRQAKKLYLKAKMISEENQAKADRDVFERQAQSDREIEEKKIEAIDKNTNALKRAANSKPHTGVTSTGEIINIIN
jgi:hypothetical protein